MPGRAVARATATRRRATSSSRARPSTRSRRPSRRRPARRSRSGCSTASTPPRPRAATAAGRQSAALLVVERDGGYAGLSDTLVDLRVDDHADPLGELRRLHRLHDALFGRTPRDRWLHRRRRAADGAARAARAGGPRLPRVVGRSREPRGAGRRRGARSTRSSSTGYGRRHERPVPGRRARRPRNDDRREPVRTGTRSAPRSAIESFGINAWTATEDGQRIIGEHDEAGEGATGHEELYVVLDGAATFTRRRRGGRSAEGHDRPRRRIPR